VDLKQFSRMPPVSAAMTPFPHFVERHEAASRVEQIMAEHSVRHVPVKSGEEIVGIVSQRDLMRLVNPALPTADKARIRADHIMTPDPYVVDLHTPLNIVLRSMVDRRIGTAIVIGHGRLAGIVTVTDVCRDLVGVLEASFGAEGNGNDAA
jgi:acetoin utilization protein AcuB